MCELWMNNMCVYIYIHMTYVYLHTYMYTHKSITNGKNEQAKKKNK